MTDMWKRDIAICDDDATFTQNKLKFMENLSGEAITSSKKYNVRVKPMELLESISRIVNNSKISGIYHNSYVIEGDIDAQPVLVTVSCKDRTDEDNWAENSSETGGRTHRDGFDDSAKSALEQAKVVSYFLEASASRNQVGVFFTEMDKLYTKEHLAQVRWWYQEGTSPSCKNIFLEPLTTQLLPEFYPMLDELPKAYLSRYLANSASVLLIAGPPGTGKTTLLRHLVSDFRLAAHIVYDENIMKSDTVFQNFLFTEESDILIIEDADLILSAREREDNKLMARFLSVSDGLIKLPNKRLVFTTNLTDFDKIDAALLRKGRCFDLLHTRDLTYHEAQAAAKAARVVIPLENREYSIAELFNQDRPDIRTRKVGFRG